MTTMPVSLQERIPIAVSGPAAPAESGAALSFGDVIRIVKQRIFLILLCFFFVTVLAGVFTWWCKDHWPYSWYKAYAVIEVESATPKGPMSVQEVMFSPDLLDRIVQNRIVGVTNPGIYHLALESNDVRDTQWYKEVFAKAKAKGQDPGAVLLDYLKDNIKASQIPNSNYIAVSFSAKRAEDIAPIVNTIIDKYIYDLDARSKTQLRKDFDYYRDQTAEKLRQLRNRRNEKAQFVSQFQSPGVTTGLNVSGENYRTLSEAATKLLAEKLQFKAAYENFKGLSPDQIAVSPQVLQIIQGDPQVMSLGNQLVNYNQQQQLLRQRLGPDHREVRQIDAQIKGLQASLDEIQLKKEKEVLDYQLKSAETAYLNATQAEIQLRDAVTQQEALQADIDRKMADYRSIEEDVRMMEEEYNQLNQYTNQLGLLVANEGTSRVNRASPAQTPRETFFPKWEINLPVGAALGLFLGVGLSLLLELIDTTLKTSRDISRHVHVPILGTVPDVDDEEVQIEQVELASRTAPRSMVAEAFRSIRTNLLLSAPAERQRTVLIASARPEEGRTTVAINLALSLAQNGRRVLLVDANFHRPAIQRFFPNTSGGGLSNILIGQARLSELAVTTDLPNLDVLPSGPIPPNPTELLAGPYLKRMITDAQDRYDQVIFDGPPVLLVSDCLVLAGVVDGVILVCRAKATSRGVALRGREQIERVNGRIFGAVLNAAQIARGGYFREQIRSYYDYQPEASLAAASMPALPGQSGQTPPPASSEPPKT